MLRGLLKRPRSNQNTNTGLKTDSAMSLGVTRFLGLPIIHRPPRAPPKQDGVFLLPGPLPLSVLALQGVAACSGAKPGAAKEVGSSSPRAGWEGVGGETPQAGQDAVGKLIALVGLKEPPTQYSTKTAQSQGSVSPARTTQFRCSTGCTLHNHQPQGTLCWAQALCQPETPTPANTAAN